MKLLILFFSFLIITCLIGCENKSNKAELKTVKENLVAVNKYQDAYDKCMNAAPMVNNLVVYGCTDGSVELANKDMNILLTQIYTKLKDNEGTTEALKEFQEAWEKYLDEEVRFDSSYVGTPQGGITRYKGISKRIDYLNDFLKDQK
jgi:uncharacterized protein YecT (DUF1311 family)